MSNTLDRPAEICCWCAEETGRAGKSEDSLYTYGTQEIGPFCDKCWDEMRITILEELMEALEENDRALGGVLRVLVNRGYGGSIVI